MARELDDEQDPDIIIDDREKDEVIDLLIEKLETANRYLEDKERINFMVRRIEVGDYLLPDSIAIERKDVGDFVNSLISGRIWSQVKNIKEYETPILVITNWPLRWKSMYFSKSNYIHKSFDGALFSILKSFSIPILPLEDDETFVEFLIAAIKQLKKKDSKKRRRIHLKKRKAKNKKQEIENIILGIPKVGLSKAQALLNHFGTVYNIFSASIDELQEVKGIGKKLAKRIRETAHKKYGD